MQRHEFLELERRCLAEGFQFQAIDLRWGITEEEAAEGTVLPLCLEEAHRCRPFVIGLLGERYGWVPKPEEIPDDLLEREAWLKDHPEPTRWRVRNRWRKMIHDSKRFCDHGDCKCPHQSMFATTSSKPAICAEG